jgi:hypothetical protein
MQGVTALLSSVAVLACLSPVLGLYSASDAVVEATARTFDREVLQYPGVVAVEFYAP